MQPSLVSMKSENDVRARKAVNFDLKSGGKMQRWYSTDQVVMRPDIDKVNMMHDSLLVSMIYLCRWLCSSCIIIAGVVCVVTPQQNYLFFFNIDLLNKVVKVLRFKKKETKVNLKK